MTSPSVTVAVVTAQTRDPLERALASLATDALQGLAEVHVVDNASSDGTATMVRDRFPWAVLHEPGANLGYGPAVDLVARATESRWLVAANSDIEVRDGALAALVRAGEADHRVAAVCPRLELPDGSAQHAAYPFPTVPLALAFNLGLLHLSDRTAARACLEGSWDASRRRRVPWAIAAFLLLRRSAYEAVGGFDSRQWMYAEDLDLGWRLARSHWQTLYLPDAAVRHEGSVATTAAFGDSRGQRWQDATYAWMRRRRGPVRTRAVALLNVAGAAARLALTRGTARQANREWLRLHMRGMHPMGP